MWFACWPGLGRRRRGTTAGWSPVLLAAWVALLWFSPLRGRATAPPVWTRLGAAPGGWHLAWEAAGPGTRYVVQSSDALGRAPWIVPDWVLPGPLTGGDWLDPRPAGANRFYRLLAVAPADRGALVEATLLGPTSTAEIRFFLGLQGIEFEPVHDVEAWRLRYETIDPLGNPTTASGALIVPVGNPGPWPLGSYQHGTLAARFEAPSQAGGPQAGGAEILIGLGWASLGYVVAMPDYLGLGESTSRQFYHHAKSEATAAVDLLRAARQLATTHEIGLTDQLFLAGYSQGGHATLALLRALETFHPDEFPVTAAAPMAGAYDLAGVTLDDVLSGRPQPSPYYFALLLQSYQAIYHLADRFEDLWASPYRTLLPPLLDGEHTGGEIDEVLPKEVLTAMNPALVAAVRENPDHPLRQALRHNSLLDWRPRAPLRLYHCPADDNVPFANSEAALASFRARGATQVELVVPDPTAGHGACAVPSVLDALDWFETFRPPASP